MTTTIIPISQPSLAKIEALPSVTPAANPVANSFSDLLSSSIQTFEKSGKSADNAVQQFLSGENEDLHTVAIAQQKAEIVSDLFLQVRNKAVSAYQEIMRMQL